MTKVKIAIVCDWITSMGGAEQVVLELHDIFPNAPIYTSVYTPESMPSFDGLKIYTTWLQRLPRGIRKLYKWFPVLQVWAFRSLDLSDFDIIISSCIISSKHVRKTRRGQQHICYCHTPTRYYWSHYEEYKKDPGFGKWNWLVKILIPFFIPSQRKKDYKAAQDVDIFIANSSEVKKRITQYYDRSSIVIAPPVDLSRFNPALEREEYYVILGRQVPYKRFDLAIKAATSLGLNLKVFGNGSEHRKLMSMAGPTVEFYSDRLGDASDSAVNVALNHAKGFIFSAEEDFGIVQVEALAAGCPVIAYDGGGVRDIVQNGVNGILFAEQTEEALIEALKTAEKTKFSYRRIRHSSEKFNKETFDREILNLINNTTARTT